MQNQSSIILTYKGKILLFSKDILVETNEKNYWDFLRIGKLKEEDIVDFLRKEISLPLKSIKNDLKVNCITANNDKNFQLFHFKLTDENVNGLIRKEGWRLEFYRFNELEIISLTDGARNLFNKYNNEIKALLAI